METFESETATQDMMLYPQTSQVVHHDTPMTQFQYLNLETAIYTINVMAAEAELMRRQVAGMQCALNNEYVQRMQLEHQLR